MITEIILPGELIRTAEWLEQRLQLLQVPTRQVPLAEWWSTPEEIHHLIPDWIPTLLSRFSLLGSVLQCADYNDEVRTRHFCFWGPAEYSRNLTGDGFDRYDEAFIAEGLVPISDESNGDLWLTSISQGPSSPIYLFDLSGDEKLFASSRIALLLASMAVSEDSFTSFGKKQKPRSVMWHPDE